MQARTVGAAQLFQLIVDDVTFESLHRANVAKPMFAAELKGSDPFRLLCILRYRFVANKDLIGVANGA